MNGSGDKNASLVRERVCTFAITVAKVKREEVCSTGRG
jgi:hypothetical protein